MEDGMEEQRHPDGKAGSEAYFRLILGGCDMGKQGVLVFTRLEALYNG